MFSGIAKVKLSYLCSITLKKVAKVIENNLT